MPGAYMNTTSSIGFGVVPNMTGVLMGALLVFSFALLIVLTQNLERYKKLKSLLDYILSFAGCTLIGAVVLGVTWLTVEILKTGYEAAHLTLQQTLEIIAGILIAAAVGYVTRKIIERIEKLEGESSSSGLAKK